jgi:hypothetical protein
LDDDPEVMRFMTSGQSTPLSEMQEVILRRMLGYYARPILQSCWAAYLRHRGQFIGWLYLRQFLVLGLVGAQTLSSGIYAAQPGEGGPKPDIYAVAFSPDGKHLAVAGDNRKLQIRDLANVGLTETEAVEVSLRSVAYSPDGARLAVGGTERRVFLWQVEPAGLRLRWKSVLPHGEVSSVCFSPQGKWLACATLPADFIRFLDSERGQLRASLSYPGNGMSAVAFLPDGETLVSGGQVLNIWDFSKVTLQTDLGQ